MTEPSVRFVTAPDGVALAIHELGSEDGRPLVLLHGFMSSAQVNWIKYGTARRLAEAGFRCIMPDLRGHGHSAAPTDAAAYPLDVLVKDIRSILETLGLSDYDLCGFSLGARTAAKLVIDGARPRRLILSGMGLEGLADWASRRAYFTGVIDNADTLERGDPGFMAAQFMRTTGVNPQAMRHVVTSFADLDPNQLAAITMPSLVLTGSEDRDNGSPQALVEALPDGRAAEIPGNHMSCVTRPEFGRAIAEFLTA